MRDARPCRSPEGKPGKESTSGSESGDAADVEAAAQQLQQGPKGATPSRLQTFRNSRLWKALTHGLNQDIHKVGRGSEGAERGAPGACDTRPTAEAADAASNRRLCRTAAHTATDPAIHCCTPVAQEIETNPRVAEIHSAAEVFDHKAEVGPCLPAAPSGSLGTARKGAAGQGEAPPV